MAPKGLSAAISNIHVKLTDSAPAPFQEAAVTALANSNTYYSELRKVMMIHLTFCYSHLAYSYGFLTRNPSDFYPCLYLTHKYRLHFFPCLYLNAKHRLNFSDSLCLNYGVCPFLKSSICYIFSHCLYLTYKRSFLMLNISCISVLVYF